MKKKNRAKRCEGNGGRGEIGRVKLCKRKQTPTPRITTHTQTRTHGLILEFLSCFAVRLLFIFNREKEPIIYDGDLMDEEGVLDFLTSLEAMDLPDRIEEVNAKILAKIIEDTDYVAVLFCKYSGLKFTYSKSDGYSRNNLLFYIYILFQQKICSQYLFFFSSFFFFFCRNRTFLF